MTHSTAQLNDSSPDDIFVWADGTWCYRSDYSDFGHMSDDFEVVKEGTQKHSSFLLAAEAMEPEDFAEFISHGNKVATVSLHECLEAIHRGTVGTGMTTEYLLLREAVRQLTPEQVKEIESLANSST